MIVQSFLVQGAAAASVVASRLGSLNPSSLDGLVLMSLGADHEALVGAVKEQKEEITCPVFLTETYGIVGFDEESGKNIELMEKGRGTEYGFRGGSGGQGCLAIGFSKGVVCGSDDKFPDNASTLMVIADQSGSWKKDKANAPLHYGGITKTTWKLDENQNLVQVPYFWVADTSGASVGVSMFDEDADAATTALMSKLPSGSKATGTVGLFPCFSRGVNQYGDEHVEPTAIASAMKGLVDNPNVYGMFAHGELGPISFADFTSESNSIPCTQHSGVSILSIHTSSK